MATVYFMARLYPVFAMGSTADAADSVALVAKGRSGQTADLFQARANTNALLFTIDHLVTLSLPVL